MWQVAKIRRHNQVSPFQNQITTFQTLASEHGAKISFAASRSSDKNGDLSSDEEDSDGDRFGKPVKKPVKKTTKKVGGASALFGVKWLRVVIGESVPGMRDGNGRADVRYHSC